MPCKGKISAGPRGWPGTRSWAVLGHAGAAGVRRRLGRARLIPGSANASGKRRSRASARPGWEPGAEGTTGEQSLAFILAVLSPSAPLSLASLRWIVPAFSLLQLFTGSPWCRHAHKERAAAEPVPVPPALPAPLRPQQHSGAIDPAGRACPGPGWAGGILPTWFVRRGAPKGLGLAALPMFGHSRFGGGNVS